MAANEQRRQERWETEGERRVEVPVSREGEGREKGRYVPGESSVRNDGRERWLVRGAVW